MSHIVATPFLVVVEIQLTVSRRSQYVFWSSALVIPTFSGPPMTTKGMSTSICYMWYMSDNIPQLMVIDKTAGGTVN